ncbi:MAG: cupin domain-containing protein [Candidatus Hydrogenedentes bacterium]|nr:cupin domain-containing protein [Candidatus Hydrogenedentota bacterium]
MSEYIFDPAAAVEFSDQKMNKVNLYESPRVFCDVYCLKPGQSQAPHEHADNDKIYHALTGACHLQSGDSIVPLPAGTVAVAPAGISHGVENKSDENATLLVMMAPHPRFSA